MAKAQYHKNQRVYVRPVGTWALVEKVIPHWTKGLDEPLRVYYDVGLGREFAAEELLGKAFVGDEVLFDPPVESGRAEVCSAQEVLHEMVRRFRLQFEEERFEAFVGNHRDTVLGAAAESAQPVFWGRVYKKFIKSCVKSREAPEAR